MPVQPALALESHARGNPLSLALSFSLPRCQFLSFLSLAPVHQVNFKEPTPPDQPLVLRSHIVKIKDAPAAGGRASVQVDLTLHLEGVDGTETLLAAGTGIFKKLGALRAL